MLVWLLTGGQPYDRSKPFSAKLVGNERVTADNHFQDVRLITLDVSQSGIRYWLPCNMPYVFHNNIVVTKLEML